MIWVNGRFRRFKRKPPHSVKGPGQNMAAAVPVRIKKVKVKTCSEACLRKYSAVNAKAATRPGPIPAWIPTAQQTAKRVAAAAAAASNNGFG